MPDCPICGERVGAKARKCKSCETELRDEFSGSLFGEEEAAAKPASTPPTSGMEVLVNGRPVAEREGPHSGRMSVVGESHYQPALRDLLARHPDRMCQVCIETEPANPHDPKAVRVCTVAGQGLGYLRREVAAEYQLFLQDVGRIAVDAELNGATASAIGIVLKWNPVRDKKNAWGKQGGGRR